MSATTLLTNSPEACYMWANGDAGSSVRRLAFFAPEEFNFQRDAFIRKFAISNLARPPSAGIGIASIPNCMLAQWSLRMLLASAQCDNGNIASGTTDILHVLREVLAGAGNMLSVLASMLGFFFNLATASLACCVKDAPPPPTLKPSSFKADLWAAMRVHSTLPIAGAALLLASSVSGDKAFALERGVSLLTMAQSLRVMASSGRFVDSLHHDLQRIVERTASEFALWLEDDASLRLAEGLREWPVLALLSDLEMSETAEVRAAGKIVSLPNAPYVNFIGPPIRMAVHPFQDTVSNHNRLSGKFHCFVDYFLQVEAWYQFHQDDPSKRLVSVEVGSNLGDCLFWAAHRLQGRIRAVGFDGDEANVATARRTVDLLQLEGQVDIIHRLITNTSGGGLGRWICVSRSNCWTSEAAEQDPLGSQSSFPGPAVTVDTEMKRMGLRSVDIFQSSVPPLGVSQMMSILDSATETLQHTNVAIVAVPNPCPPTYSNPAISKLLSVGLNLVVSPSPDTCPGAGLPCPVVARRGPTHR